MFPTSVKINELGPREGLQIEQKVFSTHDKIEIIDALSECNFPLIQITSFVSPKWVPQMADAEAVAQGIRKRPGTKYTAVCLNRAGLLRAFNMEGVEPEAMFQVNVSDSFSLKNQNKTCSELIGNLPDEIRLWREFGREIDTLGVSTAFGCNYEGDIAVDRVMQAIANVTGIAGAHELRFKTVLLGDTVGWAAPPGIKRLVGAIQDRWPEYDIRIHLHDTHGLGLANAYAALEMGVRDFDASVGGVGGCPFAGSRAKLVAGNIATEDLVNLCHECGISSGVDYARLLEVANKFQILVGRTLPGKNLHSGSLDSYRQAAARAREA